MTRLPDVSSFGARPAIPTETPVYNQPGGAVDRAAAQADAQTVAGGQELAQMGQNFGIAQARIQTRQDAVDAALKESAFTQAADAKYNDLTTQGDVADPNTVKQYGQYLTEQMQQLVGAHGGTPESQSALQARLQGIKSSYALKMGQASFTAGQARVSKLLGDDINSFVAAATDDPSKLPELFQSLDSRIATLGPAIPPEKEAELISTGRRQMVLAGVNKFLDTGDVDHAKQLLDSTPGVTRLLTPDDQTKLNKSFADVYAQRNKGALDAQTKLATFRGINGRDPTAQERLQLSGISVDPNSGPQTTVAKALTDLDTFSRVYGPNSPQAQAMRGYITKETNSEGSSLSNESAFRSQFANESKNFVIVRDAFGRIASSADQATPAGDLSLIYNFARMLDPNGAVRDQDFNQVAATGGLGSQIQGYMQQLTGQGRLSPAVRADLLNQSRQLMQSQLVSQISLEKQYKQIAARSGFAPDNVLDFIGKYRDAVDLNTKIQTPKAGEVQDGFRFKGGNPADMNAWEEVKPAAPAPAAKAGTI